VEEKLASLLGLARKAGKIALGHQAVKNAIIKGDLCLLILAEDCSPTTGKRFIKWSEGKGIKRISFFTQEKLGEIWGKGQISVAGLLDENFASAILKKFENNVRRSV
jgi:ribosomal protein L7Ae-like RNA K-turn-binding protein